MFTTIRLRCELESEERKVWDNVAMHTYPMMIHVMRSIAVLFRCSCIASNCSEPKKINLNN